MIARIKPSGKAKKHHENITENQEKKKGKDTLDMDDRADEHQQVEIDQIQGQVIQPTIMNMKRGSTTRRENSLNHQTATAIEMMIEEVQEIKAEMWYK